MRFTMLIVLAFFLNCALAQGTGSLSSQEAAKNLSTQVMDAIATDKVTSALDLLAPVFLINPDERAALANNITQSRVAISQRYGKSLGYELVSEQELGGVLLRHIFIEKHELHFTRWQFTFYKPENTWLLNALTWDDNVDQFFR